MILPCGKKSTTICTRVNGTQQDTGPCWEQISVSPDTLPFALTKPREAIQKRKSEISKLYAHMEFLSSPLCRTACSGWGHKPLGTGASGSADTSGHSPKDKLCCGSSHHPEGPVLSKTHLRVKGKRRSSWHHTFCLCHLGLRAAENKSFTSVF